MKILIFGATGFIGRNLVKFLVDRNFTISVITRNSKKAEKIFSNNINIEEWDFNNITDLARIISNSEIIINLAGENIATKRWTKNQKQKILESRTLLGAKISKAIENSNKKPFQLIQASAIGYYGSSPLPLNESSTKGFGFLSDVCEKWEKSTEIASSSYGVPRAVIRTGVVFGLEDGIFPKLVKPIKYFVGSNIGKGNNFVSWIHIDDFIRSIEFIINNKAEGVFNITSPEPTQAKHINKLIAKKLNRPIYLNIPKSILIFLIGEMANELILSNQQVFPNNLTNLGFKFKYKTIYHAIDSLI